MLVSRFSEASQRLGGSAFGSFGGGYVSRLDRAIDRCVGRNEPELRCDGVIGKLSGESPCAITRAARVGRAHCGFNL